MRKLVLSVALALLAIGAVTLTTKGDRGDEARASGLVPELLLSDEQGAALTSQAIEDAPEPQQDALADQVVTASEYQVAVQEAVECATDAARSKLGTSVEVVQNPAKWSTDDFTVDATFEVRMASGFGANMTEEEILEAMATLEVDPDDSAACRATFADRVERVYRVGLRSDINYLNDRHREFVSCLTDAGMLVSGLDEMSSGDVLAKALDVAKGNEPVIECITAFPSLTEIIEPD